MDKAALFVDRLPQDQVEIPGVGTVTVRGLSRYEYLLAAKQANPQDPSPLLMERWMLVYGMVDPALSETEVERWQKAALARELNPVLDKIRELSGLGEGADKSGVQSVRGEPDA